MAVKAAATGVKLTGAVGNAGPSGVPYINFPFPSIYSFGQLGMMKAVSQVANSIYTFDVAGGQLMPLLIRPLRDTSLAHVYFTNTNSSAGGVSLSLRNYANDAIVYSTGAVAKNSVFTNGPFAIGQYVLSAGQTYYWGCQGNTQGSYTCWIVPQYHGPSASGAATSTYPVFQLLPSFGGLFGTTPSTLSTTAAYMHPATFQNGAVATFSTPIAAYVSNLQFSNAGSGTATFALQNTTANTLVWQGPSVAAGANFTSGNIPPSTIPLTAGIKYAWYVTGSGSMAQNLTMQVCQ